MIMGVQSMNKTEALENRIEQLEDRIDRLEQKLRTTNRYQQNGWRS